MMIIIKFYGDDVFKLGNTFNTNKRLGAYLTSYLIPPEYKLISNKIQSMIFNMLTN